MSDIPYLGPGFGLTLGISISFLILLNGQLRSDIAASIIKYLEFHTESAINIRSLQVLHELFA